MTSATILVVEDEHELATVLREQLTELGYEVVTATSAEAALQVLAARQVDVILSDIHMPGLSGIELCARVKADRATQFIPLILLTAAADRDSRLAGLNAGADDFFRKPYDVLELRARVTALLKMKAAMDDSRRLYAKVEAQAIELAAANEALANRVTEQAGEMGRLSRLKRFFAPKLAQLIVEHNSDDPIRTHRSQIAVVFVDLRGFTAFAESSEPEEVMAVLQEYHAEMGRLVVAHEGTLERYAGDGMMVLFNDPVPVPEPAECALRMALAMREQQMELTQRWRRHGFNLNLGMGMGYGYATLGVIGFEGRWDYTAIGSVVNLAARLCGAARPGEIVVSDRFLGALKTPVELAPLGEVQLKGFRDSLRAYNIVGLAAGGSRETKA